MLPISATLQPPRLSVRNPCRQTPEYPDTKAGIPERCDCFRQLCKREL